MVRGLGTMTRGSMSQTPRKQDLTETSPMDSRAREDAERAARVDLAIEPDNGHLGRDAEAGESSSQTARTRTKSSTNIDTIIGKIVVDQGLATPEEVQACLEQARANLTEGNSKSLPLLLVENDFITRRQLERIKAQAEAERSGQQIPGYKILGQLGKGAMATVFKAKQLSLDREVAIKVLPRKFTNNPQFIERFYAEGRSAAA